MIINTIKDNSMLTIVEAIACGTPIVTTDVPYNCYYIENNNLGIISNKKISAYDLEEIIDNNDKYIENCIKYRQFISNEYHVKQFIEEYEKIKIQKNNYRIKRIDKIYLKEINKEKRYENK